MTLQHPLQHISSRRTYTKTPILCNKCGAEIVFSKDKVGPSGHKVHLDPFFNNEPHQQHCMYATAPAVTDLEPLLFDFLSLIPNKRQRRVIGAVGKEMEPRE